MKAFYLIAASLFLLSCGGNRERTDNDNHDSSHMEGMHNDTGFHKKHIGDLHNAMDVMAQDLKKQQFSGDADYDFALLMKRHHQGAIDMAHCLIDNGERSDLKAFATKVRDRQQHDIQEFDLIIQYKTDAKGDSDFGRRAIAMVSPMHDHNAGGTIDNTYAALMVKHHREAIRIAEAYLKEKGKHPKLSQIATEITEVYPDEIRELQGGR